MSLKRFAVLAPLFVIGSFGVLASCGEKEKSPSEAIEEAGDQAEEAAEEAGDAIEDATDE